MTLVQFWSQFGLFQIRVLVIGGDHGFELGPVFGLVLFLVLFVLWPWSCSWFGLGLEFVLVLFLAVLTLGFVLVLVYF